MKTTSWLNYTELHFHQERLQENNYFHFTLKFPPFLFCCIFVGLASAKAAYFYELTPKSKFLAFLHIMRLFMILRKKRMY